jgi:hypothetical protein
VSAPVHIDFLFLDLETCTRCRGADRNLGSALESVREVLAATGKDVAVNRIHVESAEQARRLRFASSPTIRVEGRDIALELRESPCGSEPCTTGCGDSIACRVWVHDGEEHTEPPPAMIVDAILRQVYAAATVATEPDAESFALPENLARFFADRAAAGCCSADEQGSCCEVEAKAECCGAPGAGSCGCR